MIWVCLIFLCAESPNLTSFIIVKPVAAVLLLVFGKLLKNNMSEDELNEEV